MQLFLLSPLADSQRQEHLMGSKCEVVLRISLGSPTMSGWQSDNERNMRWQEPRT